MHNRYGHQSNIPWYTVTGGYVTLLSVLIVGAVAISITVALLLSGIVSSQNSLLFIQSNQAQALSHACAEEGLQQIRDLTTYTGSGSLTFTNGSCTYLVANLGGTNRTVYASGTVGTVVRREIVRITNINPTIDVVSWQEVES